MGTWSGGSGVADRQTGACVTARTTFAIASITKAFVGAPALKLAREPLSRPLVFVRSRKGMTRRG
jgi:CubicO group peptidase (beta-lactamase class C family)